MRAALLINPSSGKGKAQAIAAQLAAALAQRGIASSTHNVHDQSTDAALPEIVRECDSLIVLGGDGTVHHALPALIQPRIAPPQYSNGITNGTTNGKAHHAAPHTPPRAALYHFALGTENLVARELGHRPRIEDAVESVAQGLTRTLDTGLITQHPQHAHDAGTPFLVMASIGPDASVVHRLDKLRTGPISHSSYIRPILAEAIRPALPRLTVHADSVEIIKGQPGLLIIANSRHYALRADPAPKADCNDGLLDLVFFPASSAPRVAFWLLRARLRLTHGCTQARAREVTIATSDPRARLQVDGEAGHLEAADNDIKLTIAAAPASINVLVNTLAPKHARPQVRAATTHAERAS